PPRSGSAVSQRAGARRSTSGDRLDEGWTSVAVGPLHLRREGPGRLDTTQPRLHAGTTLAHGTTRPNRARASAEALARCSRSKPRPRARRGDAFGTRTRNRLAGVAPSHW